MHARMTALVYVLCSLVLVYIRFVQAWLASQPAALWRWIVSKMTACGRPENTMVAIVVASKYARLAVSVVLGILSQLVEFGVLAREMI